jgi:DNA-binding transcriptional LysR family regulator
MARAVPLHTLNMDVTLVQLRSFVACVEHHSYNKAADAIRKPRQSIKPQIDGLEKALNAPVFEKARSADGYLVLTAHGRDYLPTARDMLDLLAALTRTAATGCAVAYLPQHSFFIAAVKKQLTEVYSNHKVTIKDVGLGEEHREREVFETQVIGPLAAGVFDIAIGLPPRVHRDTLSLEHLYHARLEAMIPQDDPRDRLSLQDLAEMGGLLLPPATTRSHRLLAQEFGKHVPKRSLESIIAMTAPGTKSLVSHGLYELGTVVVPSDIAYPFQTGPMFGGPRRVPFKWVPICRPDGSFLFQEVVASHRRDTQNDNVHTVIRAAVAAVGEIGLDRGDGTVTVTQD